MSLRLIFAPLTLYAKKPYRKPFPKEIKTLGDQLRKVRLERNMSQKEVAKIIGVTTDTITNWELNRNKPQKKYSKQIKNYLSL